MDKLTNNQITCLHLLNISHYNPLVPIHKHYREIFEGFANQKQINPPLDYFDETFCQKCGQIFIPGLNVTFRIKKLGSGKRMNKRFELHQKCLKCGHVKIGNVKQFNGSSTKTKSVEASQDALTVIEQGCEKPAEGSFVATWPKSENSKSKARSKKRKQNSLAGLLAKKKKDNEVSNKRTSTLDLMEFMK